VVYGSGLENRQGASLRGFESHPLRQLFSLAYSSRTQLLFGVLVGDENAVLGFARAEFQEKSCEFKQALIAAGRFQSHR
jgi:hypothetical protein